MSIATEIQRLQADSSAIASAITAKGVTVPSGSGFDDYATLIGQISTGGGGGGGGPHSLPSGYTRLSYIENPLSSNAYINTGVPNGYKPLFTIDFMSYDDFNTTTYGCILGARTASNNNDWQLTTYCTSGNGTLRLGGASQNNNAHLPSKNTRFTASLTSSAYIVDSTTYSVSRQASSLSANYSMYLFALNQANSAVQNGHGRVYSLKIYYGNFWLRDYVPCKDPNNVVGLYDLITETFFGSENSTSFVAGPNA